MLNRVCAIRVRVGACPFAGCEAQAHALGNYVTLNMHQKMVNIPVDTTEML